MKYINMDDLTTIIQNRLLIESIEKEEEILAGIEDLVISEVCAYREGFYLKDCAHSIAHGWNCLPADNRYPARRGGDIWQAFPRSM